MCKDIYQEKGFQLGYQLCHQLNQAVENGDLDKVKDLLKEGIPINWRQIRVDRKTPLLLAAMWSHWNVVRHLLREGADPNLVSSYGLADLHLADGYENWEVVTLLLREGSNPKLVSSYGLAALHLAARDGRHE